MPAPETLAPLFLLDDEPIAGWKDNLFESDTFARVVARAALGTKGPFTIGVYGDWGSGKTSVLRAARTLIEQDEAWSHVVTVEFNAWRYEREEHPIVPLVATIQRAVLARIVTNKSFLTNLSEDGKSVLKRLVHGGAKLLSSATLKTELKTSAPGVADGKIGVELEGEKLAEALKTLFGDKPPKELTFIGQQIEKSLYLSVFDTMDATVHESSLRDKENNTRFPRVIVFIDDLDRCQAEKAFELLENVKLVLSQPGCVFVLALNSQVVDAYLAHLAEKRYGEKRAKIHRYYLDKIVQLPLPMPPLKQRFAAFTDKMIDQRLSKAMDGQEIAEFKKLALLLAMAANVSPRTLVRRINTALVDTALRDPKTLPASLVNESAPYPVFSGLCIVQRTLESAIGTDSTRELATEDTLCDLLHDKGLLQAIEEVKAARHIGAIEFQWETQNTALERNAATSHAQKIDPRQADVWNEVLQKIYDATFLWYEERSISGQAIKGTSLLTCESGCRWLGQREERRAVMKFTAQRPEEPVAPPVALTTAVQVTPGAADLPGKEELVAKQRTLVERSIRQALKLPTGAPLTFAERASVNALAFVGGTIDDIGAAILAAKDSGLTALTTLVLATDEVTDAGIKILAGKDTCLKALSSLFLMNSKITDEGVKALAASNTGLTALEMLFFLGSPNVTDECVKAMTVKGSGLAGLHALVLSDTHVTDMGVIAISAKDTGLSALQGLHLGGTKVTDVGVKALAAKDSGLTGLHALVLSDTHVTDTGVIAISAKNTGLSALQSLHLGGTKVTDVGVKALAAKDTGLHALTHLHLGSATVTDVGIEALAAKDTGLSALQSLHLGGTKVTDVGVKALAAKDTGLYALTHLHLGSPSVTDVGIEALAAKDTGLSALIELDLTGANVTVGGLQALRLARPRLNVILSSEGTSGFKATKSRTDVPCPRDLLDHVPSGPLH